MQYWLRAPQKSKILVSIINITCYSSVNDAQTNDGFITWRHNITVLVCTNCVKVQKNEKVFVLLQSSHHTINNKLFEYLRHSYI